MCDCQGQLVFLMYKNWEMRQKNRCSSCLCAISLFLERPKLSHPVEAEAGVQCAEALCLPNDSTNYQLQHKSPKKRGTGPLSAPVLSTSPQTQLWDPDLDPVTNTLNTIGTIHLLHLLVLFPSVPSPWEQVNIANAVHGFHIGKQRLSPLQFAVTAFPQAALSNYFHFVPQKPNCNY